jgi:uncharacterized protein (DUF1499 family)
MGGNPDHKVATTRYRLFARRVLLAVFIPLMTGCGYNVDPMDLRLVERRSSPNDALACPPASCRATPDIESPGFSVPRDELLARAEAIIAAKPRTRLVSRDREQGTLVFVQRSRLFRFPDTIWVQAANRGPDPSLIIYSRSNYGYWDMGLNRRRIARWLQALTNEIGTGQDPPRKDGD